MHAALRWAGPFHFHNSQSTAEAGELETVTCKLLRPGPDGRIRPNHKDYRGSAHKLQFYCFFKWSRNPGVTWPTWLTPVPPITPPAGAGQASLVSLRI